MDLRIIGAFLIATALICFTWYMVTVRKQKVAEENARRKQREARNARVFNNGSLGLYEDERQRRISAETKLGITENQLTRSRKENARLKTIVAFYEDELRRVNNV